MGGGGVFYMVQSDAVQIAQPVLARLLQSLHSANHTLDHLVDPPLRSTRTGWALTPQSRGHAVCVTCPTTRTIDHHQSHASRRSPDAGWMWRPTDSPPPVSQVFEARLCRQDFKCDTARTHDSLVSQRCRRAQRLVGVGSLTRHRVVVALGIQSTHTCVCRRLARPTAN